MLSAVAPVMVKPSSRALARMSTTVPSPVPEASMMVISHRRARPAPRRPRCRSFRCRYPDTPGCDPRSTRHPVHLGCCSSPHRARHRRPGCRRSSAEQRSPGSSARSRGRACRVADFGWRSRSRSCGWTERPVHHLGQGVHMEVREVRCQRGCGRGREEECPSEGVRMLGIVLLRKSAAAVQPIGARAWCSRS